MNSNDLIQLAKDSGFSIGQGIGSLRINGYADDLMRFANAILDRAAVECHQGVARMSSDIDGTAFYIATGQCAKAIRALKINTGD